MRGIKMLNELRHGNQKMPFNNKEEKQERDSETERERTPYFQIFFSCHRRLT